MIKQSDWSHLLQLITPFHEPFGTLFITPTTTPFITLNDYFPITAQLIVCLTIILSTTSLCIYNCFIGIIYSFIVSEPTINTKNKWQRICYIDCSSCYTFSNIYSYTLCHVHLIRLYTYHRLLNRVWPHRMSYSICRTLYAVHCSLYNGRNCLHFIINQSNNIAIIIT